MSQICLKYVPSLLKMCPRYVPEYWIVCPSLEKYWITWTSLICQRCDRLTNQPPEYRAYPDFFNHLLDLKEFGNYYVMKDMDIPYHFTPILKRVLIVWGGLTCLVFDFLSPKDMFHLSSPSELLCFLLL